MVIVMRRLICIFSALLVLISLVSCAGGGTIDVDIDKTISDETLEYTLFANDLGAYDAENRIVDKWEKQFNVKFNFEGTGTDWMQTLALRINSDDMPDLFFFVPNDPSYMTAYSNFVKKQLVIPLSDVVTQEETPSLYSLLNVDDYSDLKMNGKMYFAPSVASDFNTTLYVRRDWMNKLNIQTPTTLDDFEAMLKAFTDNDPDGNGKKDTYGMGASKVFEWLSYFRLAFGVTPGWSKDASGTWQLDSFTSGYKDFLKWLNGLYGKGYLKNEFFLYDDSDALNDFYNGKCGVVMYNGGRATGGITYKMRRLDKNAKVDVIPMPDGVTQGGYTTGGNWWGGWSIAYSAKEPMRLVKFLDYMYSEEGMEERLYGLEGVHYTKDESGEIVPNFEERLTEKLFGTTDDGEPRDFFGIGAYFGSPYKIADNKIVDNTSVSIYAEKDLAKRSSEYANRNLIRNFPRDTMVLGEEYAKTYSAVSDRVYTYSVRIVSGTVGIDEGFEKMKNLAVEDGYANLQKILKDTYD